MEHDGPNDRKLGSVTPIVPGETEGYPPGWLHAHVHLNPETGEIHADGVDAQGVYEWFYERISGRARPGSLDALLALADEWKARADARQRRGSVVGDCVGDAYALAALELRRTISGQ